VLRLVSAKCAPKRLFNATDWCSCTRANSLDYHGFEFSRRFRRSTSTQAPSERCAALPATIDTDEDGFPDHDVCNVDSVLRGSEHRSSLVRRATGVAGGTMEALTDVYFECLHAQNRGETP
jgi:hypothetical protein